jgi:hypothetical protein
LDGQFKAKPESVFGRPFDNRTNFSVIKWSKARPFSIKKLWHFIYKMVQHSRPFFHITGQKVPASDQGLKTGHNYRTGLVIERSKKQDGCQNHLKLDYFSDFQMVMAAILFFGTSEKRWGFQMPLDNQK